MLVKKERKKEMYEWLVGWLVGLLCGRKAPVHHRQQDKCKLTQERGERQWGR